jgi:hypothetical protein
VGIEVAHLPGRRTSSNIDDAVPLCFDCHAKMEHYNYMHRRGKKYSPEEVRARRDQVYDEHTSHLVPLVIYQLRRRK